MKVEKRDEFKPIVITIETEKEADVLWYLLCASEMHFDEIVKNTSHYKCSGDIETKRTMFYGLDRVHNPKEA